MGCCCSTGAVHEMHQRRPREQARLSVDYHWLPSQALSTHVFALQTAPPPLLAHEFVLKIGTQEAAAHAQLQRLDVPVSPYIVTPIEFSAQHTILPRFKGTLADAQLVRNMTLQEVYAVGADMVRGVHHLAKHGCVHANLSPSNVALRPCPPASPVAWQGVLIDFECLAFLAAPGPGQSSTLWLRCRNPCPQYFSTVRHQRCDGEHMQPRHRVDVLDELESIAWVLLSTLCLGLGVLRPSPVADIRAAYDKEGAWVRAITHQAAAEGTSWTIHPQERALLRAKQSWLQQGQPLQPFALDAACQQLRAYLAALASLPRRTSEGPFQALHDDEVACLCASLTCAQPPVPPSSRGRGAGHVDTPLLHRPWRVGHEAGV